MGAEIQGKHEPLTKEELDAKHLLRLIGESRRLVAEVKRLMAEVKRLREENKDLRKKETQSEKFKL